MTDDIARFHQLKAHLPPIWEALRSDQTFRHTSVIVSSLSVNQEELSKVVGASFYEERLLFAIIRLRNPNARVVYITSQPVREEIVDYYLQLLDDVPLRHARKRLHMISTCDASARPLTEKILERPRLMARVRELIDDPRRAYLTTYNSTPLERRLSVALGIPLNGVDPDLLFHGTKSGNRKIFAEAGIQFPAGFEDLRSEADIVEALIRLGEQRPAMSRAVVKINEGFGGEGNGLFTYPENRREPQAIAAQLQALERTSVNETYAAFMGKFAAMGGIVEEFVVNDEARSPSVQMRIFPDGEYQIVSSHEQVLGGATGQSYLGCRFPAVDAYRLALLDDAEKIAAVLSRKGVIGRFAIDFLVCRDRGGQWQPYAIEINVRMGGTTPPFYALEFLTGGTLDRSTGHFRSPDGHAKFYSATDNLKSPAYRGLLPEDLFEIAWRRELNYRHATGTGALFYMIGALSQFGKIGMVCIGNSAREAQQIFEHAVAVLDDESAGDGHGVQTPLLDRFVGME